MASLEPEVVEYEKEARNIVFSLPELSRDEQAAWLIDSVKSGNNEIASDVAERAIDTARETY